jgi:hypothetical protein
MLKMMEIKSIICKEIHNKQLYKEKSLKMTGEGNHNYGKKFSEETRKKMSCSIRDKKNGVSDEIIKNVRQLLNDGYKNVDIMDKLHLSRHTVTRIKNGLLTCRDEEKCIINKIPLTQEQINVSKRKILTNEIIIVIEKLVEKWLPMKILDYLVNLRKEKGEPNNITIDIIKNIKRSIFNGKHLIYEFEIPKNQYEYYEYLLHKLVTKTD